MEVLLHIGIDTVGMNGDGFEYLVQEGHGISFLYEAAVRQELDQGSIREIPLKDFNVEHDFYFVWRKGSIFGGEYKEIFKQLKDKE